MIEVSVRYLGHLARQLSPLFSGLVLVLVAAVPLSVPGYGQIAVNLGLICVFYWSVHRPDLFPSAAAFGLGVWQDIVVGMPLGLNAVILLVACGVVRSQHGFLRARSFAGQWLYFSGIALLAVTIAWAAMTVLSLRLIDPVPGLFHAVVTASAFPPVTWALSYLQAKALPDDA